MSGEQANTTTNYTTVATITKIKKAEDNKSTLVCIRGFGQYFHEDSKKQPWNILEGNGDPKLLPTDKSQIIADALIKDSVAVQLLALSMFHKKPLKLTIEEESKKYSIIGVEVE